MQWPVRASYRLEARQALQINFPQADLNEAATDAADAYACS